MITVELSLADFEVDIDDDGKTVFLAKISDELKQIGLRDGCQVMLIDGQMAYEHLARTDEVKRGVPMVWTFEGGVALCLVFLQPRAKEDAGERILERPITEQSLLLRQVPIFQNLRAESVNGRAIVGERKWPITRNAMYPGPNRRPYDPYRDYGREDD